MKFYQGCVFALAIIAFLVLGVICLFIYVNVWLLAGWLFSIFLLANSIRQLTSERKTTT